MRSARATILERTGWTYADERMWTMRIVRMSHFQHITGRKDTLALPVELEELAIVAAIVQKATSVEAVSSAVFASESVNPPPRNAYGFAQNRVQYC